MRVQLAIATAAFTTLPVAAQIVAPVSTPPADLRPIAERMVGRTQADPEGGVLRQWPGTYFETAFHGRSVFFRIGAGKVALRISLDGGTPVPLVSPTAGTFQVTGIGNGPHRLRIDVASESQAGPTRFLGFFATGGSASATPPARRRSIEFIGDSHTVGYANMSQTARCTDDEVWATTDSSRSLAAQTAAHYDADYEVNAISGRGIVRNYNGFAADTLPAAYPFKLFDKARRDEDPSWRPQVVVISLGTNDFSTALHAGEKWATRDALHADYEATYVRFATSLRAKYPEAYIILWSTDLADGEIRSEVGKVADALRRAGDSRIAFVPVHDLAFSSCNHHPSIADDGKIAAALAAEIDAHADIWRTAGKARTAATAGASS